MKKVIIPTCMSPFVVHVNGNKYTYPAGTEQEVPDEVAIVIEQHERYHEEKAKVERGEGNQGGGGGATCKLKLNIDSSLVGWDSVLYLSSVDHPAIKLEDHIGTMEVEVPCGSLIFANRVMFYPDPVNLTEIYSNSGDYVFRAPAEPGGVAELTIWSMG